MNIKDWLKEVKQKLPGFNIEFYFDSTLSIQHLTGCCETLRLKVGKDKFQALAEFDTSTVSFCNIAIKGYLDYLNEQKTDHLKQSDTLQNEITTHQDLRTEIIRKGAKNGE